MVTAESIKSSIAAGVNCDHLEVRGDGHHWEAVIVSKAFEGIPRVRQHQLVFRTLEDDPCETRERGFGLVERRAGFGVDVSQRAAHAHLLGALTWKYERNQ